MTDISDDLFAGDEEIDTTQIFEGEKEEAPQRVYGNETIKPDRYAARVSGASILASTWVGVGSILVQKRIDPGVGRVMQLQAPLAGQKIDEVIAHTWIDRLLQPLFVKGESLEGLGAIIGLPILIGMVERKPEWGPLLMGPLSEAVGTTLEQVAPLIRKQKTSQRRAARSMSDISEAFNLPAGADPIEAITGWLLGIEEEENAE